MLLGNMYIINTGFFFRAVYSIAKAFIDEKTAKKITMLSTDYVKELSKFIDMEQFPKMLGAQIIQLLRSLSCHNKKNWQFC